MMNPMVDWLAREAGPIIRYRVATDLCGERPTAGSKLARDLLGTVEVQVWLEHLRRAESIHGSQTTAAENCIAKLRAYGLTVAVARLRDDLDDLYRRLTPGSSDGLVLIPFLVAVGYLSAPEIVSYAQRRLEEVHAFVTESTSQSGDVEDIETLYLSQQEKKQLGVPSQWQRQHVWQPAIAWVLPNCYDFYLFSHLQGHERERRDILQFVGSPRYQRLCRRRELEGTYGWDSTKRYCWSAWQMPYLHGYFGFDESEFVPNKFLLYMDLVSRYPGARELPWFQMGLRHLERYQVRSGGHSFPATYLLERSSGYYLYAAARMGLGERGRRRLHLESSFRLLSMKAMAGIGETG